MLLYLYHFKFVFTCCTIRAGPVFRYIFPAGAGSKTFFRGACFLVVYPATDNTHPCFVVVFAQFSSPNLYNGRFHNHKGACLQLPVSMPRPGLYAITPDGISTDPHGLERINQVIAGGAVLLQYRDESVDYKQRLEFASLLADLCQRTNCPLIINNDTNIAATCGAAGVHLGAGDMSINDAREMLGEQAIIGASCYSEMTNADVAKAAGASYLAFGSVFPSGTKPDAVSCSIDTLQNARRRFELPLVAIGGITVENGAALLATGVDYLAVINDLFEPGSEFKQASRFARLFKDGSMT